MTDEILQHLEALGAGDEVDKKSAKIICDLIKQREYWVKQAQSLGISVLMDDLPPPTGH